MSTVHQYMKSSDPDVVAAVERNNRTRREWKNRLFEWASELTGTPKAELRLSISGFVAESLAFRGFQAEQVRGVDLPGKWTQEPVRPYKNNPYMEEYQRVAQWTAEPVPGRPGFLVGDGYAGGGALFTHDGVAYSGTGFIPKSKVADDDAARWQELKASEYHAAVEAYEKEAEEGA